MPDKEKDSTLTDLIYRAREGDRGAVNDLLAMYGPYLTTIAKTTSMPANWVSTSDVVQRTLLEAANAIAGFRGSSEPEFSAWIQRILRNNLSNARRDQRAGKRDAGREQSLFQGESATLVWLEPSDKGGGTPSQTLIRGEEALRLAKAMSALSDRQRQALELRYFQGSKIRDVAETMKISAPSASMLVARGIVELRRLLGGGETLNSN